MEIKRKRVAVYGGSFNPIHMGHIALFKHIYYNNIADKVIFMPVADPPHKASDTLAPFEHRVNMIKLVIQYLKDDMMLLDDAELACSELEQRLPKPSFTLQTLDHLAHEMLEAEFSWVIGADELNSLHTWAPDPIRLVRNYNFIIYLRKDVSVDLAALNSHWPGWLCQKLLNSVVFDANIFPVSASEIRKRIYNDEPVGPELLIPQVEDYIRENKLYQGLVP